VAQRVEAASTAYAAALRSSSHAERIAALPWATPALQAALCAAAMALLCAHLALAPSAERERDATEAGWLAAGSLAWLELALGFALVRLPPPQMRLPRSLLSPSAPTRLDPLSGTPVQPAGRLRAGHLRPRLRRRARVELMARTRAACDGGRDALAPLRVARASRAGATPREPCAAPVPSSSAYPLRPRTPRSSSSYSTNRSDTYDLTEWAKVCEELDMPVWRTDVAANAGIDPAGHRQELVLNALAFLHMYGRMQPRSKSSPAANPRSCMAKLYAVARDHKKRGYKMAPFTLVMQVMKGQLRQYVELHGTKCLAPARKNPLTNALILKMLSTHEGSTHGRLKVKWGSYFWVSVMATFSMQAETGARKAEVSKATATTAFGKGRLSFASITWFINGIRTATPTIEQLLAITEGSGCWIVFGALKNDPFGEFFGSKPAWLPFSADVERNI
jgi:hypothetical protein